MITDCQLFCTAICSKIQCFKAAKFISWGVLHRVMAVVTVLSKQLVMY